LSSILELTIKTLVLGSSAIKSPSHTQLGGKLFNFLLVCYSRYNLM